MKQLSVFLALTLPILAADSKPTTAESHTQTVEFPAGGSVRLVDSFGELTIEGWDQPNVEITTTKSAYVDGREKRLLSDVQIAAKTDGKTVIISTVRPHRDVFHPLRGVDDIDIEYSIKVPRVAKLEIDHDHGEVNILGVTGEIHASSRFGPIMLRLPADGHYAIDAHCRIGTVYSDFSGEEKHHLLFGESFATPESATPQKLDLKVGMGDIMVFKLNGQ